MASSLHPIRAPNLAVTVYPRLREAFKDLQAERREQNSVAAPLFNLFRVLRLENDEVRLHSKLIGHLLDPRGSHGQGALFLDIFLACVTETPALKSMLPSPLRTSGWRVSTEKFTIKGNLDIVLEGRVDGILCVIENKVWAGEGDKQLSRYRIWLDLHRRHFSHRLLFFLTPDGREAKTILGDDDYIRLSYSQHVQRWLEQAIPKIRAAEVRVIAQQYLAIVQNLESHLS